MERMLFSDSPEVCHDIPGHSTLCLMFEAWTRGMFAWLWKRRIFKGMADQPPQRPNIYGMKSTAVHAISLSRPWPFGSRSDPVCPSRALPVPGQVYWHVLFGEDDELPTRAENAQLSLGRQERALGGVLSVLASKCIVWWTCGIPERRVESIKEHYSSFYLNMILTETCCEYCLHPRSTCWTLLGQHRNIGCFAPLPCPTFEEGTNYNRCLPN